MTTGFSIRNFTHGKPPRLPFGAMKDRALGKDYELSLVFIGPHRSRALNKKHRGKDKSANILSFPLSKAEGEIFIDLATAKKEAPKFKRTYTNYVGFLFIHGLIHLKGMDHGGRMEREERSVRNTFHI